MNQKQVDEAIAYNKAKNYTLDTVKRIQEVTGSTPDGVWGPRTVRSIALWQEEQGLKGDGKVGDQTLDAIVAFDECPSYHEPQVYQGDSKLVIGVWGDDHPALMKRPQYADRLVELGISEVALMMNRANVSSSADPWDLRWADEGAEGYEDDVIAEIAEVYAERDIHLILTSWPRPDRDQIDEMVAAMVPLLKITHALAWEVDVEGNWVTKFLRGFKTMQEAAQYLVDRMTWALVEAGCVGAKTEATTFGHHAELARHPTVTPIVDRVCLQGYSTSPRSGKPVPWNDTMGPGRHQEWILNRARKAGVKEAVMGLAAYKQAGFQGHSAAEAMRVAFYKTLELGIWHLRYWSSKWILGSKAHEAPYAAAHLESIAQAA